MIKIYDKELNPISYEVWGTLFRDADYKLIARNKLGEVLVSTIWLGIQHGYNESGEPLIFETIVFKDGEDYDVRRYTNLQDAEEGHKKFVKKYIGSLSKEANE